MPSNKSTDARTKERALLLMRFYWLEDLYNVGKTLRIPYFEKFANYWDIGYGDDSRLKAALAIHNQAESLGGHLLPSAPKQQVGAERR